MDFVLVLRRLDAWFQSERLPYALIGGVALAAYGVSRTTFDLDFVVPTEAQDRLVRYMENEGWETLHRSSGYSNHLAGDPDLGRVDFVYVAGTTSAVVLGGARRLPGPGGLVVPVALPEHLIAMKIAAIVNDPSRTLQDLADIRVLLGQQGVDREAVRARLERHGLERYRELCGL